MPTSDPDECMQPALCRTVLCCCLQAAATRALQRLHDIPELKDTIAATTSRDLQVDVTMSPSHSSQLNSSSTAAVAAAAAVAATPSATPPAPSAASNSAPTAALGSTGAAAQTALMFAQPSGPSATAVMSGAAAPAAGPPVLPVAPVGGGGDLEDIRQLAHVLVSGNSRWLREKAAAAVEQLATENLEACR